MNGWIVASIALVILVAWMTVTVCYAPLAIEDELGFRLVPPDEDVSAGAVPTAFPSWPPATMLLMPLWPL